jgi:hypothetical protein
MLAFCWSLITCENLHALCSQTDVIVSCVYRSKQKALLKSWWKKLLYSSVSVNLMYYTVSINSLNVCTVSFKCESAVAQTSTLSCVCVSCPSNLIYFISYVVNIRWKLGMWKRVYISFFGLNSAAIWLKIGPVSSPFIVRALHVVPVISIYLFTEELEITCWQ